MLGYTPNWTHFHNQQLTINKFIDQGPVYKSIVKSNYLLT